MIFLSEDPALAEYDSQDDYYADWEPDPEYFRPQTEDECYTEWTPTESYDGGDPFVES